MNKIIKSIVFAGIATLLLSAPAQSMAQQERGGRGNFDPEEMRQRMMERYREQLEVKADDEWKLIEERIVKVTEARRNVGGGGFAGFGFGGGRGRGGDGGGGQGRGGRGGEVSAEVDALNKALEAKASADEIKQKLAKVREVRKANEAKLEKAQDDLRQVLTVRQEARAVLMGLLR